MIKWSCPSPDREAYRFKNPHRQHDLPPLRSEQGDLRCSAPTPNAKRFRGVSIADSGNRSDVSSLLGRPGVALAKLNSFWMDSLIKTHQWPGRRGIDPSYAHGSASAPLVGNSPTDTGSKRTSSIMRATTPPAGAKQVPTWMSAYGATLQSPNYGYFNAAASASCLADSLNS